MTFDQYILNAIRNRSPENSVGLVEIINYADAHDKTVMNYDEMHGGLRRLITSWNIAECSKHQFCDANTGIFNSSFSGLTTADYDQAVVDYKKWFQEQYDALKKRNT